MDQFCDADESDPNSYITKVDIPITELYIQPPELEEVEEIYDSEEISCESEDEDQLWDEANTMKIKQSRVYDGYNESNDFAIDNYSKTERFQPTTNRNLKNFNKINVGKYEPTMQSNKSQSRKKDKQDKATTEAVLDHRGLLVINKLVNLNIIETLNGCISTGKEANVYHAPNPNGGGDYAVKIFQTVNVTFKDRDKYITGEYRYRHGYCRGNPYKMIKTWAEKEYRNLNRLHSDGVPVPKPHYLRAHIILMDFIGSNGWPAPLLKDVELTTSKARTLYRDCMVIMWKMYNKSKLVHADLSEYNMLYFEGQIIVIDVGQSVEHDHNNALQFLRTDCTNITKYFRRNGVATMTIKEMFDFLTDPSVNENNMDEYLEKMNEKAAERSVEDTTAQEEIEEEVFKNQFIPKRLTEVIDIERDISKAKSGDSEELVYQTITGLKSDLSGTVQVPEILEDDSQSSSEDDEIDEESLVNEKNIDPKFMRPRDESPESRKNRKKIIKELQAEKRKTKIKKHVKKRGEKKKK